MKYVAGADISHSLTCNVVQDVHRQVNIVVPAIRYCKACRDTLVVHFVHFLLCVSGTSFNSIHIYRRWTVFTEILKQKDSKYDAAVGSTSFNLSMFFWGLRPLLLIFGIIESAPAKYSSLLLSHPVEWARAIYSLAERRHRRAIQHQSGPRQKCLFYLNILVQISVTS